MVIKSNFFLLGKANTLIFKSIHSSAILFSELEKKTNNNNNLENNSDLEELEARFPKIKGNTQVNNSDLEELEARFPKLKGNTQVNNSDIDDLEARFLKLKGDTQVNNSDIDDLEARFLKLKGDTQGSIFNVEKNILDNPSEANSSSLENQINKDIDYLNKDTLENLHKFKNDEDILTSKLDRFDRLSTILDQEDGPPLMTPNSVTYISPDSGIDKLLKDESQSGIGSILNNEVYLNIFKSRFLSENYIQKFDLKFNSYQEILNMADKVNKNLDRQANLGGQLFQLEGSVLKIDLSKGSEYVDQIGSFVKNMSPDAIEVTGKIIPGLSTLYFYRKMTQLYQSYLLENLKAASLKSDSYKLDLIKTNNRSLLVFNIFSALTMSYFLSNSIKDLKNSISVNLPLNTSGVDLDQAAGDNTRLPVNSGMAATDQNLSKGGPASDSPASESDKKIVWQAIPPLLNFINKIPQKIRNIFIFIFTATPFILMNQFFSELFTRSTASLAQQSNADKYFIIFFAGIIALILLSLYFILEMLVTIYFIQSHNVADPNLADATKVVAGRQLEQEPQKSNKIFKFLPKKFKNSIILLQGACEEDKIKIIKHYILLIIGHIFVIIGYILILTLTQFMFT